MPPFGFNAPITEGFVAFAIPTLDKLSFHIQRSELTSSMDYKHTKTQQLTNAATHQLKKINPRTQKTSTHKLKNINPRTQKTSTHKLKTHQPINSKKSTHELKKHQPTNSKTSIHELKKHQPTNSKLINPKNHKLINPQTQKLKLLFLFYNNALFFVPF